MPIPISNQWFDHPIGLSKNADVVIIGGGFAGVMLMYRLVTMTPDVNVILLEESFPGYHTSGRTLGYVTAGDFTEWRQIQNAFGEENAAKYWSFIQESNDSLYRTIAREKISCDLEKTGGMHLATTQTDVAALRRFHTRIQEYNPHSAMMSDNELQAVLAARRFKSGVFMPTESHLNPYKLVQELAEVTEQTGRRIIANARVDKVTTRRDNITVHVRNRGKISTKNVVYCTGAYNAEFVPLRDNIVSYKQHFLASNPLPDSLLGKMPRMIFRHRDKVLRLAGKELLAGGEILPTKSLYDGEVDQKQFDRLRAVVNSVYPGLTKRFGVSRVWAAVACTGSDGLPIVGPVPNMPGHYLNIGHGFHGFGSAVGSADIVSEHVFVGGAISPVSTILSPARFTKEY